MKLPIHTDLSGKVAVVTGAGGVLCSMFSRALAASGAKVALLDINAESVQKVAAEICAEGYEAKGYACDVLNRKVSKRFIKPFFPTLGRVTSFSTAPEEIMPAQTPTSNSSIPAIWIKTSKPFSTFLRKALNGSFG